MTSTGEISDCRKSKWKYFMHILTGVLFKSINYPHTDSHICCRTISQKSVFQVHTNSRIENGGKGLLFHFHDQPIITSLLCNAKMHRSETFLSLSIFILSAMLASWWYISWWWSINDLKNTDRWWRPHLK